MSNYLVTGGAGFIGSHIVTEIVRRGDNVRVLDNLSTGNLDKLKHVGDAVEVIQGDLRSADDVDRAVRGGDYVLHQGALPSVPRSIDDPLTSNECNVNGTLNVLWAAHRFGVKRVVVASSSSVYGDTPTLPKVETMFQAPRSPYGVSKMATEQYAISFWHSFGLETVALRYFNVFGIRQDPKSQYSAVIPKFLAIMREGNHPLIYGDGEQSRDFTHVDNVVHANLLSCVAENAPGEAFNCACNDSVTLNDLVRMLNDLLGTDISAEYAEDRPGDVKHSLADISKAERLLGYQIVTPFEEGLKRLVQETASA